MHFSPSVAGSKSIVSGSSDVPLLSLTLGELLKKQAELYSSREAVVFPQQRVRFTYQQLSELSKTVANSLLAAGLSHGDKVGIMAGNCYQYIVLFLAGGRIGCPVVVLNNTYSPQELLNAVSASREYRTSNIRCYYLHSFADCKILMIADAVGSRSLSDHLSLLRAQETELREIVTLGPAINNQHGSLAPNVVSYGVFVSQGAAIAHDDDKLKSVEARVSADEVANVQFTSGSCCNQTLYQTDVT